MEIGTNAQSKLDPHRLTDGRERYVFTIREGDKHGFYIRHSLSKYEAKQRN